ncbi:MAG: DMT family transporter [Gemmatimonadales bacterium]|jgi:drug/metabolite transporter (DMT)-like permease
MTLPETGGAPGAPGTDTPDAAVPAPRGGFTTTDGLLTLMTLIWGINVIVVKAALDVFSPLAFNAFRFTIGAVVIALVARRLGRGRPARADWGRLALLGILGNFIYQVAFIEGLDHTRAGNASLIMGTGPIYTALFSHLRGHERVRGRDAAGIFMSILGLVSVVVGGGKDVAFEQGLLGDILILFGTVCWSAYTVGSKPLVDRYGSITATAWTMAIGAVPLVLIGAPDVLRMNLAAVPLAGWGAVVYSSLFALVLAFLFWYRGVERLGSTRTATYSNFQPVIVLLIAWPLLHETPTLWQIVGAGGIFSGIYLTRT